MLSQSLSSGVISRNAGLLKDSHKVRSQAARAAENRPCQFRPYTSNPTKQNTINASRSDAKSWKKLSLSLRAAISREVDLETMTTKRNIAERMNERKKVFPSRFLREPKRRIENRRESVYLAITVYNRKWECAAMYT